MDLFANPVGCGPSVRRTSLAISRLSAAKYANFSGICSETEVSEQVYYNFMKTLGSIAHNVLAVCGVLTARIRALRSIAPKVRD